MNTDTKKDNDMKTGNQEEQRDKKQSDKKMDTKEDGTSDTHSPEKKEESRTH